MNNRMEATESTTRSAGPKLCKENRYYYRHREEILARQKQRKMEDPEFAARCQAREKAREEKEIDRVRRAEIKEEKRLLKEDVQKKQREEVKLEKARIKREMAEEKANAIEQKRLLKATLLGAV